MGVECFTRWKTQTATGPTSGEWDSTTTAVYLSGNMYNSSSVFQYAKIRVLLKSDLYNAAATILPYQDVLHFPNEAHLQNVDGSLADSITPVHQRGKPTAVNSQLLINATTIRVPATYLTVWKIVDPTANPLVVTRTTVEGSNRIIGRLRAATGRNWKRRTGQRRLAHAESGVPQWLPVYGAGIRDTRMFPVRPRRSRMT